MNMAGYAPNQIDSIILATTTPDRPIPATSSTVQRLLGAKGCSAVDMNAACAGFGYALVDGYSNINSGEGPSLVIGTDLLTRVTDPHDRGTAILFGDGSGAVLLQKSEREDAGLLGWYKTGNGELEEHLYCDYGEFIQMNGQSVYRNAIPLVVETSRAALEDAELETSQIKLMIPHQANKRIIDSAAKRLKITDDKVVWTGREYANTSSASIPLAFAEAMRDGRIERGDKILMVAFGAGMTGVAMVIQY
jgi:3-oxoacyl-[acyl-carrier-protein] synthase-3